jgi:hypothetical protein
LAVVALLLLASSALAGWSTPRPLSGSAPAYLGGTGPAALTTDARGDAALAWREFRKAGRPPNWWYDSFVHVAFAAPTGRIVTHTVWARGHSLIAGVTEAFDARGELSVAWVEQPSPSGGPITVRALRRSPAGHWSATQTVGRSSTAFFYAKPELAVAPDGEMLLTWNAGSAVGVKAAWRSPGHDFGAASVVDSSKAAAILDPTPIFDPGGAAHVYGTVDCDGPKSRGVMLSTPAHSHHFLGPVVVAPAPAENLVISFSAPGRALAAWQHEDCSTLEADPGSPYARVMLRGSFAAPVALDAHTSAYYVTPVAANAGGGSIAWVGEPFLPGALPSLMVVTAGMEGVSTPSTPADGLVPVGRDAAGDLVLQDLLLELEITQGTTPGGAAPASPVAVQPIAGRALEPSPLAPITGAPPALSLPSSLIAEPGVGRGVALAWTNGVTGRVAIATWRP